LIELSLSYSFLSPFTTPTVAFSRGRCLLNNLRL
jgi:hypothetical protein